MAKGLFKRKKPVFIYSKEDSDFLLKGVKKSLANRKVKKDKQERKRMDRAVQAGKVGRFSNGVGVGY